MFLFRNCVIKIFFWGEGGGVKTEDFSQSRNFESDFRMRHHEKGEKKPSREHNAYNSISNSFF